MPPVDCHAHELGASLNHQSDGAGPSAQGPIGISGVVVHFAAEREIFAEGDEARSFYKVVSGTVRTCRFLSDGRRQIDAFYKPVTYSGWRRAPNMSCRPKQYRTVLSSPTAGAAWRL